MKTIFLLLVAIITLPTQAAVIYGTSVSIASSVQENQSIELDSEILGFRIDKKRYFKLVSHELFTAFNHDVVLSEKLALGFVEFKNNNFNNDDNNLIMGELLKLRRYVIEQDDWLDDKVIASPTVSIPAALWLFAPVLVGFMGLPKQSRQA